MDTKMLNALKTWIILNDHLHEMTEDEVHQMLVHEAKHEARRSFLERLHQRYNALRVMRERREILGD